MNLFATDPCPIKSAQNLDDARLVNQVRETAQLISGALFYNHPLEYAKRALYKPTHMDHPVSRWTRQTRENWRWAVSHANALAVEYSHRFGKVHASSEAIHHCLALRDNLPGPIGSDDIPFAFQNSARNKDLDLDFTHITDVHQAYRHYLLARWETAKRPPRWTNRDRPVWMGQPVEAVYIGERVGVFYPNLRAIIRPRYTNHTDIFYQANDKLDPQAFGWGISPAKDWSRLPRPQDIVALTTETQETAA